MSAQRRGPSAIVSEAPRPRRPLIDPRAPPAASAVRLHSESRCRSIETMDHGANTALLCVLCLCACTAVDTAVTPSAPTAPPPTGDHATTDPPRWRFDVEPYVWLPSTSGTGTTTTTP